MVESRKVSLLVNGKRYDEVFMDVLASEFKSPLPGWPDLPGEE